MDTIRIFSKRAFQFDHPTNAAPSERVDMQSFADVPDWVKDSAMFKLAAQDEDVMIIEGKQDEVKAEVAATDNKGSKKGKTGETTTQP